MNKKINYFLPLIIFSTVFLFGCNANIEVPRLDEKKAITVNNLNNLKEIFRNNNQKEYENLVARGLDGTIYSRLFSVESKINSLDIAKDNKIFAYAVENPAHIVIGSLDSGENKCVIFPSGKVEDTIPNENQDTTRLAATSISFSKNSKLLAGRMVSGELKIWDTATCEPYQQNNLALKNVFAKEGDNEFVAYKVIFIQDDKLLLVDQKGGNTHLRSVDFTTGKIIKEKTYELPISNADKLVVNNRGDLLAMQVYGNSPLHVIELNTLNILYTVTGSYPSFSPDNKFLAINKPSSSSLLVGKIGLIDAYSGKEIKTISDGKSYFRETSLNSNGTVLAINASDKKSYRMDFWDTEKNELITSVKNTSYEYTNSVDFSSNGERLIVRGNYVKNKALLAIYSATPLPKINQEDVD
jgi:WD40 repeat protein